MTKSKENSTKEREDLFDIGTLVCHDRDINDFKHKRNNKSFLFKLFIFIMYFLVLSIIYRGIQLLITGDYLFKSVMNNANSEMPIWYPITTIAFGITTLLGVVLINFYKKKGIYIVIVSLLISVMMQPEFMPDGTLFTMFTLFVFIGYGLAILYPYRGKFR